MQLEAFKTHGKNTHTQTLLFQNVSDPCTCTQLSTFKLRKLPCTPTPPWTAPDPAGTNTRRWTEPPATWETRPEPWHGASRWPSVRRRGSGRQPNPAPDSARTRRGWSGKPPSPPRRPPRRPSRSPKSSGTARAATEAGAAGQGRCRGPRPWSRGRAAASRGTRAAARAETPTRGTAASRAPVPEPSSPCGCPIGPGPSRARWGSSHLLLLLLLLLRCLPPLALTDSHPFFTKRRRIVRDAGVYDSDLKRIAWRGLGREGSE